MFIIRLYIVYINYQNGMAVASYNLSISLLSPLFLTTLTMSPRTRQYQHWISHAQRRSHTNSHRSMNWQPQILCPLSNVGYSLLLSMTVTGLALDTFYKLVRYRKRLVHSLPGLSLSGHKMFLSNCPVKYMNINPSLQQSWLKLPIFSFINLYKYLHYPMAIVIYIKPIVSVNIVDFYYRVKLLVSPWIHSSQQMHIQLHDADTDNI